jgi:mRNA-degrading endonuclease RelE of RelBE toxin-antitoxin system
MPDYEVVFTSAAREGFGSLDRSEQIQVAKQLEKLKRAPRLGKPLGNKMGIALVGYRKLYACNKRVRIIYGVAGTQLVVSVIAIGPREDARVYVIAEVEARKRLRLIPNPLNSLPNVQQPPS